jgi:fatty acid desaturase
MGLSDQIAHQLFPDLPARRYPELAVEVRELRERYALPHNSGLLSKQLWMLASKICVMVLPDRTPQQAAPMQVEAEPVAAGGARL